MSVYWTDLQITVTNVATGNYKQKRAEMQNINKLIERLTVRHKVQERASKRQKTNLIDPNDILKRREADSACQSSRPLRYHEQV